jgi:hypothetical protein
LNDPLDNGLRTLGSQSWALTLVENLTCVSIYDCGTQVRSTKVNADIVIHERITLLSI